MAVVTIRANGLETENDFLMATSEAHKKVREFRETHEFETMQPEEWEEFYQIQAQAVWLEDTYTKIKEARQRRESLGKNKRRTIWERAGRGKWEEEI